jgi:hypothetical protein
MKWSDLRSGDPYYNAWVEYRRIGKRSYGLALAIFFGGAILVSVVLDLLVPNAPGSLWLVLMIPLFFVSGRYNHRARNRLCPRCGEPFHWKGLYYNDFARRCVRCGLPKWAPRPL